MTKISYLRKRLREEYKKRNLPEAADIGNALLNEHTANRLRSQGYANDLFNVALVYDELEEFEQAASMYIASIRHICGHGCRAAVHTIFLHSLNNADCLALSMRFNNLAGIIAKLGDYEQAREMYKWVRSLNSRLKHEDIYEDAVTSNLYNMGNVTVRLNSLNEAQDLHDQALTRLSLLNGSPEDIINSLHSIAHIHEKKGDYNEAIHSAGNAAEHAAEHAGGMVLATAHYYLAGLHEANGEDIEALDLYEKVLEEISPSSCMRRDYMIVLGRRANLVCKMGDTKEAIEYYEEVLDIYNRLTGLDLENIDDAFYPTCIRNMAELYLENGDYDKLANMLVSVLAQPPKHLGLDLSGIENAITELAFDEETIELLKEALRDARAYDSVREMINRWQKRYEQE